MNYDFSGDYDAEYMGIWATAAKGGFKLLRRIGKRIGKGKIFRKIAKRIKKRRRRRRRKRGGKRKRYKTKLGRRIARRVRKIGKRFRRKKRARKARAVARKPAALRPAVVPKKKKAGAWIKVLPLVGLAALPFLLGERIRHE